MSEISIREADEGLLSLLEELDRAGEIIIKRDGERVAKLVPAVSPDRVAEIIQSARRLRESIAERGQRFSWDELKALRDEGRP